MSDDEIKRCAPDDPNRCQAVVQGQGQCPNLAVPGTKYCKAHGGARAASRQEEASLKNYRIARASFNQRAAEMANSSGLKSLRDEISLMRVLLEEHLNSCEDTNDLLLQSAIISDLILKIEKLVVSCNKLETSLGETLDKSQILHIAGKWIDSISEAVAGLAYTDDQKSLILEAVSGAILSELKEQDS